MIVQLQMQTRLDGKGFVEKFLVEGLFWFVDKDTRDAGVVKLRTAGASHHLQHVSDWHVHVLALLRIEIFGALDDDQVTGQIDAPCCKKMK